MVCLSRHSLINPTYWCVDTRRCRGHRPELLDWEYRGPATGKLICLHILVYMCTAGSPYANAHTCREASSRSQFIHAVFFILAKGIMGGKVFADVRVFYIYVHEPSFSGRGYRQYWKLRFGLPVSGGCSAGIGLWSDGNTTGQ